MAKEHECDSRGRPSFVPLDDAELDEDNDDEDVDEDGEIPMVESGSNKHVKHGGEECWKTCGQTNGKCDYCGTGYCCRVGYSGGGCNGQMGTHKMHTCVGEPYVLGEDVFSSSATEV